MTSSPALPSGARLLLASRFVTNVGNGMFTLAVAKLLYDRTGSVAAFGLVIISEFVITLLLSLLAGSVVDRGEPKAIAVWADLIRGSFVLLTSVALLTSFAVWFVFASVLVINVAKPFYRSSTFSIIPAVAEGDALNKYNAYSEGFVQAGQLVGVAIVGPLIQLVGTPAAFAANGLSFILAGAAIALVSVPPIERKVSSSESSLMSSLVEDWKEIAGLLRSSASLGVLVVLCAGGFLVVELLNLAIVPIVDERLGGNAIWLSVLDGSYAVGALAVAGLVTAVVGRFGGRNTAYLGMTGQALLFVFLAGAHNPYVVAALLFGSGVVSTFSFTVLYSSLQRRSKGSVRGRVGALQRLTTAAITTALIPVVVVLHSQSLAVGLIASASVCAVFGLSTLLVSRRRLLGDSLLGTDS